MLLVLRSRGTPHSPIRRLLAGRDRSLRRGNPRGLAGPAGRTRNLRRGLSGRHRGLLVVVGMTTAGRPPQRSGAVWRWPSAQACLCWSKCAWRALQAVRGSPGLQAEAPPLWGPPINETGGPAHHPGYRGCRPPRSLEHQPSRLRLDLRLRSEGRSRPSCLRPGDSFLTDRLSRTSRDQDHGYSGRATHRRGTGANKTYSSRI